jgi:hypothetical protein
MKCKVTNISSVAQTIFPEAGSVSLAVGDNFTGEFSADRVEQMRNNQPGKFRVDDGEPAPEPVAEAPAAQSPQKTQKRHRRG